MYILKVGGSYFSHFKNGKIRLGANVSGAHIFATEVEVEMVERMLEKEFTRLKVSLSADRVEEGDMFNAKYDNGNEGVFLCTEVNVRKHDAVELIVAHDVRLRRPKDCYFIQEEIIELWKKQ